MHIFILLGFNDNEVLLKYILYKLLFSYIVVFGAGLNCYKSKSKLVISLLVIRATDDECKLSFWYFGILRLIMLYSLVYLYGLLREQQIKLVLNLLSTFAIPREGLGASLF